MEVLAISAIHAIAQAVGLVQFAKHVSPTESLKKKKNQYVFYPSFVLSQLFALLPATTVVRALLLTPALVILAGLMPLVIHV